MLDTEEPVNEVDFVPNPLGPSSKGCCKVLVGNSCGSGSLVGKRDGKSLLLTNSHVTGTRIGTTANCTFPFLDNRQVQGRVIMAGYSNQVMMDWSIVELNEELALPHTKLSINAPGSRLYTAGYPRCQGPRFQELRTTQITHSGTVWRGQPASIGGQSGSGIHAFEDNLQRVLLTWLWGGDCAGQTTKAIWFQYTQRAAVGFTRPPDLIELADVNPEIEQGFFAEANITTLPIWAHLDDPTTPPSGDLKAIVLNGLDEVNKAIAKLARAVSDYQPSAGGGSGTTPVIPPADDNGTFGL